MKQQPDKKRRDEDEEDEASDFPLAPARSKRGRSQADADEEKRTSHMDELGKNLKFVTEEDQDEDQNDEEDSPKIIGEEPPAKPLQTTSVAELEDGPKKFQATKTEVPREESKKAKRVSLFETLHAKGRQTKAPAASTRQKKSKEAKDAEEDLPSRCKLAKAGEK